MSGERYGRLFQVGDCKPSLQTKDHDGWLLLDGRTIQKKTYPELFAKLQIVDATLILADSRGRALVGATASLKPGQSGGTSALTLTIDNIPSHSHGYSDDSVELKAGQTGLLGTLVTILSGNASKTAPKTTNTTGSGKPIDLPMPPHIGMSLFVYAGRSA